MSHSGSYALLSDQYSARPPPAYSTVNSDLYPSIDVELKSSHLEVTPIINGSPVDMAEHLAGIKGVGYIAVSANQSSCYLLRSDGRVDRTKSGGKVSQQFVPDPCSAGVRYISVSAGLHCSYLTRSDGVVIRTRGNPESVNAESEMNPPPGLRYITASAGPHASYLLRSDGVLERTTGWAKVSGRREAPGSARYAGVSAGISASFFTRDDGVIDRATVGGETANELSPDEAGARYVSAADQCHIATDKGDQENWANYFIRDDGAAVRTVFGGKTNKVLRPPPGVRYIAGSAGTHASYLLRDDGAVDRLGSGGKLHSEMRPPPGARYVAVTAGPGAAYLLRSDGLVDRTTRGGKISSCMTPPTDEEIAENARPMCSVM